MDGSLVGAIRPPRAPGLSRLPLPHSLLLPPLHSLVPRAASVAALVPGVTGPRAKREPRSNVCALTNFYVLIKLGQKLRKVGEGGAKVVLRWC